MGLFGKSKKELLEWQNMVSPHSQIRLNEKQLQVCSQLVIGDSLRIIQDCVSLCNTTKKPDVFFTRYDLLLEHSQKVAQLSKYVKFKGTSPVEAYNQVVSQRQQAIRDLIMRCLEEASAVKTESAKAKRFQKLLGDFLPYESKMDPENWNYLNTACFEEINRSITSGKANKLKQIIEIIEELNKYIIQVQMQYKMPNDFVVNPYYADPAKTKIENQPLTSTGKIPKYTKKLNYSIPEIPEIRKMQFGEAWLLPNGSVGKARMITWINRNALQINLAIINDVLSIRTVEIIDNTAEGWQVLYKA